MASWALTASCIIVSRGVSGVGGMCAGGGVLLNVAIRCVMIAW